MRFNVFQGISSQLAFIYFYSTIHWINWNSGFQTFLSLWMHNVGREEKQTGSKLFNFFINFIEKDSKSCVLALWN